MTKSKGRTGAHARANIQPAPTAAELDAARREVAQIEGRLVGLAAGHPSVKIWRVFVWLRPSLPARHATRRRWLCEGRSKRETRTSPGSGSRIRDYQVPAFIRR